MTADSRLAQAIAAQKAGRIAEAQALYRTVLDADPCNAPALTNLGLMALAAGRHADASAQFEAAAACHPGNAILRCHLSNAYRLAGDHASAHAAAQAAQALAPGFPPAHMFTAMALEALGRHEEAGTAYLKAVELGEKDEAAIKGAARCLLRQGRDDEALDAMRANTRMRPDDWAAHWRLAVALLERGQYQEGWAEFEWRLAGPLKQIVGMVEGRLPRWDGVPSPGRRILLVTEQGMGDTLQFLRYAKRLADLGAHAVVAVQPDLHELLRDTNSVLVTDRDRGIQLNTVDCFAPLLSLPHILGPQIGYAIPPETAIPAVPADVVGRWRSRLRQLQADRVVGVTWQGNPGHALDATRSFPAEALRPLADIPGVKLVSLQKFHGLDQLERPECSFITDLADEPGLSPMMDTAARLATVDLVVACDSMVAHLAASMGQPTWIPLSANPDWRWGNSADTTEWYSSVRLFRQSTTGDWSGPFAAMAAALGRG